MTKGPKTKKGISQKKTRTKDSGKYYFGKLKRVKISSIAVYAALKTI
ncbi:MAG: hypothetical protein ACXWP5_06280 [Bdellovibrionota bacterium]